MPPANSLQAPTVWHLLSKCRTTCCCTALAEGIATMTTKPVLHGDNGSTLKATTVLGMLYWLGVKPSYSRPRVSDDNAYAESLFRTAKYRPEFSAKGFANLDAARTWAAEFVLEGHGGPYGIFCSNCACRSWRWERARRKRSMPPCPDTGKDKGR